MRGAGIGVWLLCLALGGGMGTDAARAQPDSVRAAILKAKGFSPDHSPRGALWRAAVLPGWGQFYNHQYYKIPFVYAGLAGGGFAIRRMNRQYLLYRHANLFIIGQNQAAGEGGTNPYQKFEDDYNRVVERVGGELRGRQLRRTRDKFRRWRDLAIVGTGLFYALTILDAYVSAHLLAIDVGGDLALEVRPTGGAHATSRRPHARGGPRASPPPTVPNGAGLRLRLRF